MLRGEHARLDELPEKLKKHALNPKKKISFDIPFYFPSFALNPVTIKIFNWLFYHKQGKKHLKNFVDLESFFTLWMLSTTGTKFTAKKVLYNTSL